MIDNFLMSLCESDANYLETVRYLSKHHPVCIYSGADKNWRRSYAAHIVNQMIRQVMFDNVAIVHSLNDRCIAVRLYGLDREHDSILLSVIPR